MSCPLTNVKGGLERGFRNSEYLQHFQRTQIPSQNPHDGSQPSVTQIPGNLSEALIWHLLAPGTHVAYIQSIGTHKTRTNRALIHQTQTHTHIPCLHMHAHKHMKKQKLLKHGNMVLSSNLVGRPLALGSFPNSA